MRKSHILVIALLVSIAACAPYTAPSDMIDINYINPSMLDDDFSNQVIIRGEGFLMLNDVYFRLGGITGTNLRPGYTVNSDNEIVLNFQLADADVSTPSETWHLILVTNHTIMIEPFTNILIREYYVKFNSSGTGSGDSGSWWARYFFTDGSSIVLEHEFYQPVTASNDLYRGDVSSVVSLSNNLTTNTIFHTVSIIQGTNISEKYIISNLQNTQFPTNGEAVWMP